MNNIWYLNDWTKHVKNMELKKGVYVKIDKNVPIPVRAFYLSFVRWIRMNFEFPIKVTIYIKDGYRIKAKDGEMVVGTFWRPYIYGTTTYIRIATGDYYELLKQNNEEQVMWSMLLTLTHELTHYFQYINKLPLTEIEEEKQAEKHSNYILQQYDKFLFESQLYGDYYKVWLMTRVKRNAISCEAETGIKICFDKGVNKNIRKKCMDFARWLRQEYFFTTRVNVHIKVKQHNSCGEKMDNSIIQYKKRDKFIETCDIFIDTQGRNIPEIFYDIAYGITFYRQTINDMQLTTIGKKRQATKCAKDVLDAYYL